ncbi:NUDIX hydrolase [Sinorhizobium meliloti]|uniref:NUDIX hydrolase n=1 Tax=Rhizobium meliloti TaxID=382 RepID=UPI0012949C68|nr:NUDIX hydrolase [Sinorhizobium meliloti]MQW59693.1 NUDIX domain-containing protein [Sinorhizobium meliloti]
MKNNERYLARLAPLAATLMKDGAVEQVGAICRRIGEMGSVQVLLITTRDSRRWTVPKGWPIKNLKPHQVAEREAWEEAGIIGKAKKRPLGYLGYYTYLKTLDNGQKVVSVVAVHLVKVDATDGKFPEQGERQLEWLSPSEAAARVQEPELKGLLMSTIKKSPPRA